jgi:leucyl/phenylalanyl-tRNA--protein transferase
MHYLTQDLYFPSADNAGKTGLLAVGGDLSVDRLLLAYRQGIFPWYNDNEPILWWSPEKRMVVDPKQFKPSKSLRNIINRKLFQVTYNKAFEQVINCCRSIYRPDQDGTWLTKEMVRAYLELHEKGYGKSVEVWQDNRLVGGLYGVDLGVVFCGESMFSSVSNASKVAFTYLVALLKENNYQVLDGQLYNPHLASLGAFEISRADYLRILEKNKPLTAASSKW